jgi:cell division protein FtsW
VLFPGGLDWLLFAGLAARLAVAFSVLIVSSPYRLQRILGFMDPWSDSYGKGYQLSHSLIAFGRGEWFGVGLGGSVEKLFYLPGAHTDFLLAVIAEELGFAGVLAVILLFLFVVHRAFAVGRQAASLERYYAALVAQGIGVWLAAQAFINMGVNTGLLPTKGLTLPLLSFGGTGIVVTCAALGILLRVDWENRYLMRGARGESHHLIMAAGPAGTSSRPRDRPRAWSAAGTSTGWARPGMENRLVPRRVPMRAST